jgi:hypothetical protein
MPATQDIHADKHPRASYPIALVKFVNGHKGTGSSMLHGFNYQYFPYWIDPKSSKAEKSKTQEELKNNFITVDHNLDETEENDLTTKLIFGEVNLLGTNDLKVGELEFGELQFDELDFGIDDYDDYPWTDSDIQYCFNETDVIEFDDTDVLEFDEYYDSTPDYYFDNLELIDEKFETEFAKYSHYITSDKDEARAVVDLVKTEVSNLKFENCIIELSPLNSVKFKVKLAHNKILIVTKTFISSEEMMDKVFFSLIVDNDIIITDVLNLTDLIDGIQKYLAE